MASLCDLLLPWRAVRITEVLDEWWPCCSHFLGLTKLALMLSAAEQSSLLSPAQVVLVHSSTQSICKGENHSTFQKYWNRDQKNIIIFKVQVNIRNGVRCQCYSCVFYVISRDTLLNLIIISLKYSLDELCFFIFLVMSRSWQEHGNHTVNILFYICILICGIN